MKENWNNFYQHLGYALYAVAMADGRIKPTEISAMRKSVEEKWMNLEESTDEFGSDAAFQSEIVFDWLSENQPEPQKAFKRFESYFIENPEIFSDQVKKLVLESANDVASSFAGKNKSELVMLSKLNELFYS